MLNGIFVVLVLSSVLLAAYSGGMQAVTDAIVNDSRAAAELALKLVGVMAFFLGLMRVAQDGGILRVLARALSPIMRRLFPNVPADHPAMSAMILNLSSNLLGLGNAATPFGIKAMEELDRLNGEKGTASNAMVLFLALNTAGLAILPSGVIGIRASLDSQNAAAIFFPTWFASGTATVVGVTVAILLSRLPAFRRSEPPVVTPGDAEAIAAGETVASGNETADAVVSAGKDTRVVLWRSVLAYAFLSAFLVLLGLEVYRSASGGATTLEVVQGVSSFWMLPLLVSTLVLFGWARGVRVYESLVEGAKEGFQVAIRIIPYLVAILVAVGMFRASGGIALIADHIGFLTSGIGMPAEALPMAILRPLTGSGALGVMTETMIVHGPDSFIGYLVSTYQGSTETTFYVLAVYFGAVGVRRTRHTLIACLAADVAGILAATFIVNLMFGQGS